MCEYHFVACRESDILHAGGKILRPVLIFKKSVHVFNNAFLNYKNVVRTTFL